MRALGTLAQRVFLSLPLLLATVALHGEAKAAGLTSTWTDNSINEEGFKIERKKGTGTFALIAVVGANAVSYTDSNLTAATIYCFRVQAFSTAGHSIYSNEACGTTPEDTPVGNRDTLTLNSAGSLSIGGTLGSPTSTNNPSPNGLATAVAKIGIFRPATGEWMLDLNGNGKSDGCEVDACLGPFGNPNDLPVVGDWDGTGITRIGVFDPNTLLWRLDLNGDGHWDEGVDLLLGPFGESGDLPVVGDWDGTGITRIGVKKTTNSRWWLDLNGNGMWDGCTPASGDRCFGFPGQLPVVGDWTGLGTDMVGVFTLSTHGKGVWLLDLNGNGKWDNGVDWRIKHFGQEGNFPVVGDWDGTGRSKVGVFIPSSGLWQLDLNGNGEWDGCEVDACLGPFGQEGDIPVVGRW